MNIDFVFWALVSKSVVYSSTSATSKANGCCGTEVNNASDFKTGWTNPN
jgi:hypothetical protein